MTSSGSGCDALAMRALVQRVERAAVTSRGSDDADWETIGEIGAGHCVFIGATHADTVTVADKMAAKIWGLRILDDDDGVMNRSLSDVAAANVHRAQVLIVSQFTLYGDARKGRRPSWIDAARPEHAEPLVDRVVEQLRTLGAHVETGRFRTELRVQ